MEIVVIIILILINGLFSMSEIALVSSRKFKLENATKKGSKGAKEALLLISNPSNFLSTVQIGITLVSILTGIFSGESITKDLQLYLSQFSQISKYSDSLAVLITVFIITFVTIVFGELIPKRIGMLFPERISSIVAPLMHLLSIIAKPFVFLLISTNDIVLRIFGIKGNGDALVSEEEIKAIISESVESGEIQEIEHEIVNRVFVLGDRKVSELMTHRNHISWLDMNDSLAEIKKLEKNEIHSIFPVCEEDLDEVKGVVFIKDLFSLSDKNFKLSNHLRTAIIVPANTMVYTLLDKFKTNKMHFAVVVDEYGVVQGVITMDDILDALVGDVSEDSNEEYQMIQREDGTWLADGQYPFYEFLQEFDLPFDEDEISFNTLGGFLIQKIGELPKTSQKINWNEFIFEIIDMDGNRIDKILITNLEKESDD